MTTEQYTMFADGGSRGNPGPAGYGAIVYRGTDVVAKRNGYLGEVTNNVAEYHGLVAGLEAISEVAPDASVVVNMDSKLVVEQMSGRWKIKHPDMRELAIKARDVAAGMTVTYKWIPRAENGEADGLANDAMDARDTTTGDFTAESSAVTVDGTPFDLAGCAQPAMGYAGDVAPEHAYAAMEADENVVLVDVRTMAEWQFVGVPLTPAHSADASLIEWTKYPTGESNVAFLASLKDAVPDTETAVLFLCRSGARSASAARAATLAGYVSAYNVASGFEGDLDQNHQRRTNGWKHAGLPWRQS